MIGRSILRRLDQRSCKWSVRYGGADIMYLYNKVEGSTYHTNVAPFSQVATSHRRLPALLGLSRRILSSSTRLSGYTKYAFSIQKSP